MRTDASAEPVAIEFANTRRAGRRGGVELLPDDEALTAWIRESLGPDLAGCLHPGDRDRFLALRDAVRAVAGAISNEQREPADEVARLNVTAAAAPTWHELVDGRAVQRTAAAEVDAALATLAASAIETFGGTQREQVRACGRWPLCVRFFVKNHPRRGYCSPNCANRARAMRHHDRHKDED
jgi:predicted RNA-binding Zn ribbon-like protein